MSKRIDKTELSKRVAKRLSVEPEQGEEIVSAVFEEIYDCLKNTTRVNITHFGTFYIDERRHSTVFKFNPSQRLRALFGWSSTYKGDL